MLGRNKVFGMVEICLVCGNGPDHRKVVRVMSRLGFLTHPTSHHEHMLGGRVWGCGATTLVKSLKPRTSPTMTTKPPIETLPQPPPNSLPLG